MIRQKNMITVIKKNVLGEVKVRYEGEIIERLANSVMIEAHWGQGTKELGYTQFEPGDRFIEYYYTDRWYNIFDIASADGTRKGWYCNVAEPATIFADKIEQVDLFLDVWVDPNGHCLVLDEDEFQADTTLNEELRSHARQGLSDLLALIAERHEMFANINYEM
jgi:predicted RNA-binding protein associated with RNAse of E/G family